MHTDLFAPARLHQAFAKVRRNSDCAGVDGVTPSVYSLELDTRLGVLQHAMENGTYLPRPLRAIALNQPGKKPRTLSVPTVDDRIAQTAVALALTPRFEARFADFSYGYRPARSVPLALEELTIQAATRPVLVDADIRDFFGSVGHSRLQTLIDEWVEDDTVRTLTRSWIAQHQSRNGRGIALGSPISPLFANLYLDQLDRTLASANLAPVRYADDFVIACLNEAEAGAALRLAGDTLGAMGLELNAGKTQVVHWNDGIDFLGARLGGPTPDCKKRTTRCRETGQSRQPDTAGAAPPVSNAALTQEPPVTPAPAASPRIKTALVTLYITEPGCLVKREGERIVVSKKGVELASIPIIKIDQVIVLAQSALTAGVLTLLTKHRIPLVIDDLTDAGTPSMFTAAAGVETMERQFERARDPHFALAFARRLVTGKIANARTVLKRYARERGADAVQTHERALVQMGAHAARAPTLDVLRGCEGFAAKSYFAALRVWLPSSWGFTARATRPAPDPFNALLSFGYTLLMQNVGAFIQAAGLHPQIGFLHARRPGHPALASDLMEEFRPIVVDSLALNLVLNNRIAPSDFCTDAATGLNNRLTPSAKKRFITAFEEKLASKITHEDNTTPVDFRQAINLQARRALAAIRDGTPYKPFRVR